MFEITATLVEWRRKDHVSGGYFFEGIDESGNRVFTSRVVKEIQTLTGTLVYTTYKQIFFLQEHEVRSRKLMKALELAC